MEVRYEVGHRPVRKSLGLDRYGDGGQSWKDRNDGRPTSGVGRRMGVDVSERLDECRGSTDDGREWGTQNECDRRGGPFGEGRGEADRLRFRQKFRVEDPTEKTEGSRGLGRRRYSTSPPTTKHHQGQTNQEVVVGRSGSSRLLREISIVIHE